MAFTTLISTAVLDLHRDDGFAIVDCRFKLDDTGWGEREYGASHIPGAVYAHLDRDLSGPKNGSNGRHPLPAPDALAATFARLGIGSGVQVVAYDQDCGMYASRVWWLLRWLGHDAVAVLDGGFARWTAEGRPTTSAVETRPARDFSGTARDEMMVDAGAVKTLIGDSAWRLVDARAPERFRGAIEPIDRVAGHIPGAVNYPYPDNLDANGLFRTPAELRTRLQPVVSGVAAEHIVCYCGSGVSACHNLLALEHAGVTGARLYPGSWSEWSSDPKRPVASGD